MHSRLLTFYIYSLPFVSAFALTGTITISLLLSILMMAAVIREILITKPSFTFPYNYIIIIAVVFWASAVLSYVFNSFGFAKSINHLLAYSTVVFLFLLTPLLYLYVFQKHIKQQKILKAIFQITLFCTVFTIIEFVAKNTLDIDINEFLPRPTLTQYDALAISLFQRARGFAEESGHFALFLEAFTPISLYYLFFSGYSKLRSAVKVIFILIIYTAWLLTVSTAGFICLPISILITLILNGNLVAQKSKLFLKYIGLGFLLIAGFLVLLNLFLPIVDLIWFTTFQKSDSSSFDDRTDRINFFNNYFFSGTPLNFLFGYGPAGYSNLGFDETRSIVSFYLTLIFELGISGSFVILILILFIIFATFRLSPKARLFFQTALFTTLLHYFFIGNYWFPWLWFLSAVIFFLSFKQLKLAKEPA